MNHDGEAIWSEEQNIDDKDMIKQYRTPHMRTPSTMEPHRHSSGQAFEVVQGCSSNFANYINLKQYCNRNLLVIYNIYVLI